MKLRWAGFIGWLDERLHERGWRARWVCDLHDLALGLTWREVRGKIYVPPDDYGQGVTQ